MGMVWLVKLKPHLKFCPCAGAHLETTVGKISDADMLCTGEKNLLKLECTIEIHMWFQPN
jgi:hypothetical protein